jgi:competence protein ComEA
VATVDINQASPLDLQAFKGIGPAMGQRILEARRQQGFHNWPDLMARVPGMGPHKADALSAQGLTVNGLRYGEVGDPPARPWQPFEALPLKPMPLPSKANRHP